MTAIVLRGDARQLPLPDGCVDLIVTSPPFYALRSYTDGGQHYANQIGAESTPEAYLEALWDCTREWMRVLKPDGNLFVELGDKYSGAQAQNDGRPARSDSGIYWQRTNPKRTGIPAKSLMGLPWRYANGCVDYLGLIHRRDIIWHHVNGLPESVTDRCRSAHSYVFHFTKQPRYYAAVDEIREPHTPHSVTYQRAVHNPDGYANKQPPGQSPQPGHAAGYRMINPLGKLPGSVWPIPSAPLQVPPSLGVDHFAAFPPALVRPLVLGWSPPGVCTGCGEGRRPVVPPISLEDYGGSAQGIRDYWHDVKAATGLACACTPYTDHPRSGGTSGVRYGNQLAAGGGYVTTAGGPRQTTHPGHAGLWDRPKTGPRREYHFARWTPPPTRPAIVLDPFGGTGTTALVASTHGRLGITVDRSMDYARLAQWRVNDPGERARARDMPKPPPIPDGMDPLFEMGPT